MRQVSRLTQPRLRSNVLGDGPGRTQLCACHNGRHVCGRRRAARLYTLSRARARVCVCVCVCAYTGSRDSRTITTDRLLSSKGPAQRGVAVGGVAWFVPPGSPAKLAVPRRVGKTQRRGQCSKCVTSSRYGTPAPTADRTVEYSRVRWGKVQYKYVKLQYSTVSTLQYGTVQYATV